MKRILSFWIILAIFCMKIKTDSKEEQIETEQEHENNLDLEDNHEEITEPELNNNNEDPYFRLMINHQVPYYQGGWGPVRNIKPLTMTPPIQTVEITNAIPSSPKMLTQKDLKTKVSYDVHTYPQHMASPFNQHSFFNIYNPNTAQITGSSPLHSASMGTHPFSNSGMISPFMNPYAMMNPMMMGAYGMANSIAGMGIPGMGAQYSAFQGGLGSFGSGSVAPERLLNNDFDEGEAKENSQTKSNKIESKNVV